MWFNGTGKRNFEEMCFRKGTMVEWDWVWDRCGEHKKFKQFFVPYGPKFSLVNENVHILNFYAPKLWVNMEQEISYTNFILYCCTVVNYSTVTYTLPGSSFCSLLKYPRIFIGFKRFIYH